MIEVIYFFEEDGCARPMNRRKSKPNAVAKKHEMTGREFLSLPLPERQRIVAEIEAESPEDRLARSTPLTPELRRRWSNFKRGRDRPQIGRGSTVVSLSVEKDLLKRADAYAKAHGLKRSELLTRGLLSVLGEKAVG